MSDDLRRLARDSLVFNAPLSEERAADLVERLALAPGGHVLDLGCGCAELLLRVVSAHPGTTGTGLALPVLGCRPPVAAGHVEDVSDPNRSGGVRRM